MNKQFLLASAISAWSTLHAQAPAAGPLILLLPPSARATAMGSAGAALRDDYSIFYNPAQIVQTNGIGASATRYQSNGSAATLTGGATVGSLTYGWGFSGVKFDVNPSAVYPLAPAALVDETGRSESVSYTLNAAASYLFKGFRTGAGVKYAEDRTPVAPRAANGFALLDLGISHPLLSGTVGVTIRNLGNDSRTRLPTEEAIGFVRGKQLGEFDMVFAAELSQRNNWVGGGGGVEMSYGWIEGYSLALRAGAHRTETSDQLPATLGGALVADHLTLDYALEPFRHSRFAHHLTIRLR